MPKGFHNIPYKPLKWQTRYGQIGRFLYDESCYTLLIKIRRIRHYISQSDQIEKKQLFQEAQSSMQRLMGAIYPLTYSEPNLQGLSLPDKLTTQYGEIPSKVLIRIDIFQKVTFFLKNRAYLTHILMKLYRYVMTKP